MTDADPQGAPIAPQIDWQMSAALQDVPRGDGDLAEVTSLEGAVRAWAELDPDHRSAARLTPERPLMIGGAPHAHFVGEEIAGLAGLLPADPQPAA